MTSNTRLSGPIAPSMIGSSRTEEEEEEEEYGEKKSERRAKAIADDTRIILAYIDE